MDKKKIEYEDSFVAFLDVLGFTNFVNNGNTDKISTYLESAENAVNDLKNRLKENNLNINHIIISDSIIISIQKDKNNNKDENINIFRNLCSAICVIQSFLSINDIWLRGAISSGESSFNKVKNQIIGKAYINAYTLESKISNPQVIIDNKIINELNFKTSEDLIQAINNKNDKIINASVLYDWNSNTNNRIKKEFPLFIDYQSLYFQAKHLKGMKTILLNIEKNIYSRTELYSKYKWVSDYILSLVDKSLSDTSQSDRLDELNEIKMRLQKL